MTTSIIEQDRSYRRGLILGITMAEIVVLVIFCLLLALALLLARQAEQVRELEKEVAEVTDERDQLIEKMRVLQAAVDQNQFDDLFQELVVAREQLARQADLEKDVAALQERIAEFEPIEEALQQSGLAGKSVAELEAIAQRAARAEEFERVLKGDGLSFDGSEKLKRELALAAEGRNIVERLQAMGITENPVRAVEELVAAKSALEREVANLRGQLTNARDRLAAVGKGTEMPACWADQTTGKPEYIFDVALTNEGLIVRDRELPHRRDEQAMLPIEAIEFNKVLAPGAFLRQAQPLYEWSVNHDCRFFVRAYDLTGSEEKEVYKRHMRYLEERFYKYEVLNERF